MHARRALATPFRKGSRPMIRTSARAPAGAAMCSPPPKPISSQVSLASGIRVAGVERACGARICGSRVFHQGGLARLDRARLDAAVGAEQRVGRRLPMAALCARGRAGSEWRR